MDVGDTDPGYYSEIRNSRGPVTVHLDPLPPGLMPTAEMEGRLHLFQSICVHTESDTPLEQ